MSIEPAARRARHLMDPSAPRQQTTAEDLARLQRVQRWVLSILVATTILHLSVALVIAATFIDDAQRVPQVGLCVLASAFGALSLIAAFAIHRRPMLSPWVLLGLVPGVVGLVLVLS